MLCVLCGQQMEDNHLCLSNHFLDRTFRDAILALQYRVIKLENEARAATLALGLPIPPRNQA